jgi:glycosyltransferase involved in cell wall biosynthesis
MVNKKGLKEKIIFIGHRDDVPEVTAALDIAVLASHFEGMGRVLLEAMAAGLPVVATRVGGVPDLVIDGETGILVGDKSPILLAEAISRLTTDAHLRQKMGDAGFKRVGDQFSTATMVRQIDAVYHKVLTTMDTKGF